MHRHQYRGHKLSRSRDQRRALLKGLATTLVECESITTTKPKAREAGAYVERLIVKAKVGSLHARRQVRRGVSTEAATKKLLEDLAPRFKDRPSGFTRVKIATTRKGDNAQLAVLSFTEKAAEQAKASASSDKLKTAKPVKKVNASKKVPKKEVANA